MITRLEVDGFKSLRNFAVDFDPLTVLVGANDAGKSNILEAIALVTRLDRQSPEEALRNGRGRATDQFWRHHARTSPTISVALECVEADVYDEDGNHTRGADRLRYSFELLRLARAQGPERVELQRSSRRLLAEQDAWRAAHPEWNGIIVDADDPGHERQFTPFFHLVQLDASHLRQPSERIDSGALSPDASNLASVLAALPAAMLGEMRAELAGLVPGVASFDVVERDESLHIEFRTRDGARVPARLASDGTLRMLALLTAVFARRGVEWDSVICIEEPENGIHPPRLARLVELLVAATDAKAWCDGQASEPPPQVIVTTHSPVVLAALARHRDAIRFIDTLHRDGMRFTRARRVVAGPTTDRMTEAEAREIDALWMPTRAADEGP